MRSNLEPLIIVHIRISLHVSKDRSITLVLKPLISKSMSNPLIFLNILFTSYFPSDELHKIEGLFHCDRSHRGTTSHQNDRFKILSGF